MIVKYVRNFNGYDDEDDDMSTDEDSQSDDEPLSSLFPQAVSAVQCK